MRPSFNQSLEMCLLEVKSLNKFLDEKVQKSMEALQRIGFLNGAKPEIIIVARKALTSAQEQIRSETKSFQLYLSETSHINFKMEGLKRSLLEAETTLLRSIQDSKDDEESISEKLKFYDGQCARISTDLKGLENTKKSVYKKVLKKTTSIRELTHKTVKILEEEHLKARHEIEKSIVALLVMEEKEAQATDVCFAIDSTHSMQLHIDNARDMVINIINDVKNTYPDAKLRVSIVAYRDFGEPKMFEVFDFSESILDARNFLANLVADGGKDGPEDVNGGFQKIYTLQWKNPVKNIVHIADAPCHGVTMNGGEVKEDFYPQGHKKDVPWTELLGNLKKKEINYLFLKYGSYPEFMFNKFKEIYTSYNFQPNRHLIFEMKDLSEDKFVLSSLTSSYIKSTIASSLKATYSKWELDSGLSKPEVKKKEDSDDDDDKEMRNAPLKLSDNVVDTAAPQFENESFFDYTVEGYTSYRFGFSNIEDVTNVKLNETNERANLLIRKTPFAKGKFCLAFHCKAKPSCSQVYFNMVLKKSIKPTNKAFYFDTLKKNVLVNLLANEFNKELETKGFDKNHRLYFTSTQVVKINSEYFLLEPFIPGKFEKFTNNHNYVNENVPFMTAFSHFTYTFTKGKYMVTDLQGSNNLLTDPAVHSDGVLFREQADIGLKGMMGFFSHHECNDYCRTLGLPAHEAQKETDTRTREAVHFNISSYYKKCNYYFCSQNAGDASLCDICSTKVNFMKFY